jgi:hypothetical protein
MQYNNIELKTIYLEIFDLSRYYTCVLDKRHMDWRDRMAQFSTTSGAVVTEALGSARTATVPALVGLFGASVSLPLSIFGLPLFFLAVSLPMSVLGLVLGIRQRNDIALLFAAAGIAIAVAGLALG